MVSFLEGLGAFGGGFTEGLGQGVDFARTLRKNKREDDIEAAQLKAASKTASILGKYLPADGGFSPTPAQPQMQPGQASVPMQLPGAQPQGGGQMESILTEAANKYGVPPQVLLAIGKQESSLNPNAPGGGLMQILPSTARQPGFGMQGVDPATLRDPRANADFAAHYLAARNPGVNWQDPAQVNRALQSYNGGGDPRYVEHVRSRMGGAPPAQAQSQSEDIFSSYQKAMRAVWTDPDFAKDQRAQMAAAEQVQQQFAPFLKAAQEQSTIAHQRQMEAQAADKLRADERYHEGMLAGQLQRAELRSADVRRGQDLGHEDRQAAVASRDRIASAHDALREKLGMITDERMRAQFQQRVVDKQRDYDLAREKFENGKSVAEKRQALSELRAKQSATAAAVRSVVYGKAQGLEDKDIKDANELAKQFVQELNNDVASLEAQVKDMSKGGTGGRTPSTTKEDASPAAPKPGDVVDGFRFKGGDPADKNAWEKI